MNVWTDPHFAKFGDIPRIPASTPLRVVFDQLAALNKGGFLLVAGSAATSYVIAFRLAERILAAAAGSTETFERLATMRVGDVVATTAPNAVVRINQEPVEVFSGMETFQDLRSRQDDVVFRVDQGNQPVGYYLAHEHVRATLTQRVWFFCTNPHAPHANPGLDHGRCFRCPFPLGQARTDVGSGSL